MINRFLSIFCLFMSLACSIHAGTSLNQETVKWIQQTALDDAEGIIDTLDYTFIQNDYQKAPTGANQALIFYKNKNGKKEARGIVKYIDKAGGGLTTLGILPSEQAARERFAFLLHEVLRAGVKLRDRPRNQFNQCS